MKPEIAAFLRGAAEYRPIVVDGVEYYSPSERAPAAFSRALRGIWWVIRALFLILTLGFLLNWLLSGSHDR
jgi:hypothetical protein